MAADTTGAHEREIPYHHPVRYTKYQDQAGTYFYALILLVIFGLVVAVVVFWMIFLFQPEGTWTFGIR